MAVGVEQRGQPAPAQPDEAEVAAVGAVEAAAQAAADDPLAQGVCPPQGDAQGQQQPVPPVAVGARAGLEVPAAALAVEEGGLGLIGISRAGSENRPNPSGSPDAAASQEYVRYTIDRQT